MKAFAVVMIALMASAVPALANWTPMGTGVTFLSGGSPCRVAIAFGGFGYEQADTQSWMTHLSTAANFAQYGIKDFIAIKGPADSMYNGHEIGNSHIVTYLKGLSTGACVATGATPLSILAFDHSSGGFVAAEWMGQMASALPTVLARTILYDLDGGAPPAAAAKHLKWFFPTSTIKTDGSIQAMNYGKGTSGVHNLCKAENLAATMCRFINVKGADTSGCISPPGSKGVGNWCLHMMMVNQHPHSQDLSHKVYLQDMNDVTPAHPIQTDWIDQTRAELAGLFGTCTATSCTAPHPPPSVAARRFRAKALQP